MWWFYENVSRISLVPSYDIHIDMSRACPNPIYKCQKAIYLRLVVSDNRPIMEPSDLYIQLYIRDANVRSEIVAGMSVPR